MAGFDDKETARKAGEKSKRGQAESTTAIKQMVTELVSQGMEKSVEKLKEIEDPIKYLETISKFIQYVLPKNVDLTSKGESLDTTSMTTEELKERLRVLKDIDKEIERE